MVRHTSLPKIVITGGGTGGHVFPALALAEEWRARGGEILYVGSAKGMEARLVPPKNIPFFTVKTGSVKNQGILKVVKTFFQLGLAILWSLRFLMKHRPKAVLGVGGYVSVPICFSAFLLGIPLFLQEQNVSVGIANRFLGKLARKVFLGFSEAERYFPPGRTIVSGNPLRRELSRSDFPAIPTEDLRLLIMGGSQGAKAINDAIVTLLPGLQQAYPGLSIVHQTGEKDYETVVQGYRERWKGKSEVMPFIPNVADRYGWASLVISRSGALTVSELLQVKRPAIFVPYPRKGQNDQTANAYHLEKHGAALVVEQGESFSQRLWAAMEVVMQKPTLEKMHEKAQALQHRSATPYIIDCIEKDLGHV